MVAYDLDFVRWLFRGAALYGALALLPMYFQAPPEPANPVFYYGFIGVAFAWQIAFWLIASDPLRLRLLILPGIVEKLGFGGAALLLWAQDRLADPLLALGGAVDLLMAAAFLWAFLRLAREARVTPGG